MTLTITNQWPDDVPLPFLDYSGTPRNNTIASEETTPKLTKRSRFTRSYNMLNVKWVLDDDQYAAFQSFIGVTCNNGASQFSIELRFPKNTELTAWAARLEDGYEAEHLEGNWSITAVLELVNPIVF